MNERAGSEATSEERIGEVLGGYLEALEAGQEPGLSELLAGHPDLAGELAAFFAQQERFALLVAPLREAAQAARGEPPTEADPEATRPRTPSSPHWPEEETVPDPGETIAAPPPPGRGSHDGDDGGRDGDDGGEPTRVSRCRAAPGCATSATTS
jgi:hypothetical protein